MYGLLFLWLIGTFRAFFWGDLWSIVNIFGLLGWSGLCSNYLGTENSLFQGYRYHVKQPFSRLPLSFPWQCALFSELIEIFWALFTFFGIFGYLGLSLNYLSTICSIFWFVLIFKFVFFGHNFSMSIPIFKIARNNFFFQYHAVSIDSTFRLVWPFIFFFFFGNAPCFRDLSRFFSFFWIFRGFWDIKGFVQIIWEQKTAKFLRVWLNIPNLYFLGTVLLCLFKYLKLLRIIFHYHALWIDSTSRIVRPLFSLTMRLIYGAYQNFLGIILGFFGHCWFFLAFGMFRALNYLGSENNQNSCNIFQSVLIFQVYMQYESILRFVL